MADLRDNPVYCFASFALNTNARLLCRDDVSIPLTPKEFLTLRLLVEASGQAVKRETLIGLIWPDTIVGDTSLGRNISVLRRHLGSSAIQSIPKFGYRFTLPVTVAPGPVECSPEPEGRLAEPNPVTLLDLHAELAPQQVAAGMLLPPVQRSWPGALALSAMGLSVAIAVPIAGWVAFRPHAPKLTSGAANGQAGAARELSSSTFRLAVLPFRNLSPHSADTDYLRDGLNDELTARLGSLNDRQLRVLARGTTRQYLDTTKAPAIIAAESGANYLLEGSVAFNAGHADLIVSLVNAADQTISWSKTYSGDRSQFSTMENQIVEAVASNIEVSTPAGPARRRAPANAAKPAAYDEYLRGRFEIEQKNFESYRRALAHFQAAAKLDPSYAKAHAGIAETYIFLGGIIPMNECFSKGREAALKAIQLDPDLSEAHRDLAYILMNDEADLRGAEVEYRRAIQLNSADPRAHHWYAQLLASERRSAESLAEATIGYQLDPRSLGSGANYGFMLVQGGQAEKGVQVLEELVRREPGNDMTWGFLGFAYQRLNRLHDAATAFDKASDLSTLKVNYQACAAYARARNGDTADAVKVLKELNRRQAAGIWFPAQSMVIVQIALNNREEARRWLLKGTEDRTTTLFEANTDPIYSEMKDDPGFREILARLEKPR